MKKFGRKSIVAVIIIILFCLYWVLVNVLVSASLVPSFMEKLEAFERITEQSYAEQVQTTDIKDTSKKAWDDTVTWFKEIKETDYIHKLSLTSQDGYKLVAVEFLQGFQSESQDSNKWVILLHGYTGWKEEMYPFAYWYYQQGYNVLTPDLRCQGESEGDYIGMGYTDSADMMGWIRYILENNPDSEIILHGQSMGAATALMMASREDLPENVKAVVSDCAYTDAYSMFGDKAKSWFHLPAFPLVDSCVLALKVRGGYDLRDASPIESVSNSKVPILFIHGEEDAMISVDMAYELYGAANCKKDLLIVKGAGHAQSQDKAPEAYYDKIQDFLN